jgi:hypothetical protein
MSRDDPAVSPELTKPVRPLLTETLHRLLPDMALVDCAATVNAVLDAVEDGDVESARQLHDALQRVLTSDAAEAEHGWHTLR